MSADRKQAHTMTPVRPHGPSRPFTMIGGAEGEEDLAPPKPCGESLPLPDDPHSQTGTTWLDALLPAYRRLRRRADMMPDPEAATLDEESQAD